MRWCRSVQPWVTNSSYNIRKILALAAERGSIFPVRLPVLFSPKIHWNRPLPGQAGGQYHLPAHPLLYPYLPYISECWCQTAYQPRRDKGEPASAAYCSCKMDTVRWGNGCRWRQPFCWIWSGQSASGAYQQDCSRCCRRGTSISTCSHTCSSTYSSTCYRACSRTCCSKKEVTNCKLENGEGPLNPDGFGSSPFCFA